jgi:hypothetical protein
MAAEAMQQRALDPARVAVYSPGVLAQVPRFLAELDREPRSPTFGRFDRDYWSWKFRDFPILMPQWGAYGMALLWSLPLPGSPYVGNERVLDWTRAALRGLCDAQQPNGSFETVGPNVQDHGATCASLYYLAETADTLGTALSDEDHAHVDACLDRAAHFAARSREDYAFVSNHQALFALGLRVAGDRLGRSDLIERSDAAVDAILAHQAADGHYDEYGGFDPGYESLGIAYLAKLQERSGDTKLLASLHRSVSFLAHAVHEDGTLGGVYGSRHTRLYFPSGIEILSASYPDAAAIALHLRERLALGNVVTPASVDTQNLYVVLLHHLQAAAVEAPMCRPSDLPCRVLQGVRQFPGGLCVAGTPTYYAVLAGSKGGVGRIDDRASGRIAWEDAGWAARIAGRWLGSQALGSRTRESPKDGMVVEARFTQVGDVPLTPLRFVVLRLLMLTAFRVGGLARWIRQHVIGRIITSAKPGPLALTRQVTFEDARVVIRDRFRADKGVRLEALHAERDWTTIHMGSAGYHHRSDLVTTPVADGTRALAALHRGSDGEVAFALGFGAEAGLTPIVTELVEGLHEA